MTTSEQARADAMADAETLRAYWWREHHEIPIAVNDLAIFTPWRVGMPLTDRVARLAARAAFRAVPGLRGE